jgi:hypothetical protein
MSVITQELEFQNNFFVKFPNIKFHKNDLVVLELLQAVKRHRYGEANRFIFALAAKTPKTSQVIFR